MNIPFTKMHGIGNDYVYINCMDGQPANPAALSVALSPRHVSVGADGLVLICPSKAADAKMRMFNADGSEGKMCGNAIRCVGKYLWDNGLVRRKTLTVETLSGVKTLHLQTENGKVISASVDMGRASFAPEDLPIDSDREQINAPLTVDGKEWKITCVSMGNPHAVVFVEDACSLPLAEIGPGFEHHPLFPERVNTEFVQALGPAELKMRVWERGSGETRACGTGACAAAAAAVRLGICAPDAPITVHLRGGDLTILCGKDYAVTMTGPAAKVYDGVYEYEDQPE